MLRTVLTGVLALAICLGPSGCAKGSLTYGSELPIYEDVALRGRLVQAETGEPVVGAHS